MDKSVQMCANVAYFPGTQNSDTVVAYFSRHTKFWHNCSLFFQTHKILMQEYGIVLKYWDTQRIGTSLKIVKIIILADPKYWTILRKRKNIRKFSDPKNWDGVFGAPKWSKTCLTLLVYKRCPHALSPSSLVNKGDTAKPTPLLCFSMQFCLKEYT